MKRLLIYLIKIYQKVPGSWHDNCRHIPTCSNYAIGSINQYGVVKGCYLSIKRILRCNPLGTSGYDPVVKENKK